MSDPGRLSKTDEWNVLFWNMLQNLICVFMPIRKKNVHAYFIEIDELGSTSWRCSFSSVMMWGTLQSALEIFIGSAPSFQKFFRVQNG